MQLETAQRLLKLTLEIHEDELTCDECNQLIDLYAELKAKGEDPEKIYPLVKFHLDICPPCVDEFNALLELVKEEFDAEND